MKGVNTRMGDIENIKYLIIGIGLAGLRTALELANTEKVVLLAKKSLEECNTSRAAGGIACVWQEPDSFDAHVQDTLRAGDGLCDERVVREIVKRGPERLQELIQWGVDFDMESPGKYELGMEGGHSHRRILHSGDLTGKEIHQTLLDRARKHPNIEIRQNQFAINLIKKKGECAGVHVYDVKTKNIYTISTKALVLATGGAGKAYLYTSNSDVATGDGIAMAYRIGTPILNMEMLQFHPTCLYNPLAKNLLVSEALRGEGAVLKDVRGKAFMKDFHPRGDLASRDIISRAIDKVMKEHGDDFVYLDITHKEPAYLRERFPSVYSQCKKYNIDITTDPIPVVPAAHYLCGGIKAEINGETPIPGLYAVGECSCTGFHGANRLASNSLLECLVCGYECGHLLKELSSKLESKPFVRVEKWESGHAIDLDEMQMINQNWMEIRQVVQHFVGIVRTNKSLLRARARVSLIHREVDQFYWDFILTTDLIELRNLVTIARLIVESAIARKESRGIHYNKDHPERIDENIHNTEISKYW